MRYCQIKTNISKKEKKKMIAALAVAGLASVALGATAIYLVCKLK